MSDAYPLTVKMSRYYGSTMAHATTPDGARYAVMPMGDDGWKIYGWVVGEYCPTHETYPSLCMALEEIQTAYEQDRSAGEWRS